MNIKLDTKTSRTLVVSVISLLILLGSFFRITDHFELSTLDFRFQLRPKIKTSEKIVFVEIANDTINQLGQFPIDRNYHAVLVQALSDAGAEAVVFDIFFSEPRPYDEEFEKAINAAGNVYFPHVLSFDMHKKGKIVKTDGVAAETLAGFTTPAKGVGHINIIPDSDGKYRRAPLLVEHEGEYFPYLSFGVILDSLNIPLSDLEVKESKYIKYKDQFKIPLVEQSTMVINFSGPWGKSYQHYSYIDILKSYIAKSSGEKPLIDLETFKDKICIIGLTAEGTTDLHPNPYEVLYPAVGLHAEVMSSVLNKSFIARASRFTNFLILGLLLFIISWSSFKYKPLKASYVLLGEVAAFAVISILLFVLFAYWIDVFYPTLMMVLVYAGCTLYKYVAQWKKTLVMENELQIAKKIQESFLPKKEPEVSGLDTAAVMCTARHVGGDLYDYLKFDDETLGVMIGDVTGKGVPASLFMAMAVSAFKFFANKDVKPEETLYNLNEKLRKESSSNLFVTTYYSIFDTKTQIMTYGSGGHNPMLYIPAEGEPQYLDVKEGPPVGMIKAKYSGDQLKFNKGDVFIYYTDGVTEARNDKGEMFEEPRLAELAKGLRDRSAKEIVDVIMDEVFKFEPRSRQHDDVTAIVVKIV